MPRSVRSVAAVVSVILLMAAAWLSMQDYIGNSEQMTVPLRVEQPSVQPQITATEPTQVRRTTRPSEPEKYTGPPRLVISSIGMDSQFMPIDDRNNIITPTTLNNPFWWIGGASPGATSDTLFAYGHTVRGEQVGVFDRLQEVKSGDRVKVYGGGRQLVYTITETRLITKWQLPPELYAPVRGRIVLVSCNLRQDGERATDNFVAIGQLASE